MSLELHCFLVVNLRSAVFLRLVLCSKMSTLCSDYTAHLRWVAPFAAHGEKEKWFHSLYTAEGFLCEVGLERTGLRLQNVVWRRLTKCTHTHRNSQSDSQKELFSTDRALFESRGSL